jgi:hypothetical protein
MVPVSVAGAIESFQKGGSIREMHKSRQSGCGSNRGPRFSSGVKIRRKEKHSLDLRRSIIMYNDDSDV